MLFYLCIAISIFLSIAIVFGYINIFPLKLISKIILLLIVLGMIAAITLIQLNILTNSILTYGDLSINFSYDKDIGYNTMFSSMLIMIANYLVYLFLA